MTNIEKDQRNAEDDDDDAADEPAEWVTGVPSPSGTSPPSLSACMDTSIH